MRLLLELKKSVVAADFHQAQIRLLLANLHARAKRPALVSAAYLEVHDMSKVLRVLYGHHCPIVGCLTLLVYA